ncbi:ComF family protein [Actinomadura yumaensis]|uniref:ComF family protein n=1 Tax=Actinomadura yumaensis TaxID=111807 RepID=UPI00361F7033
MNGEAEAGEAKPTIGAAASVVAKPPVGAASVVGAAKPAVGESVVVVPVASGRRAVRRRGHDPTRRMAAVAVREARAGGLRVVGADVLRQRREVADQAGLTASGRVANLAGALEVVPGARLAGRRVVLVDDVITTGASLAEAARAVRRAGAEVAAAATVAATPLRRGA